jgi:uncharacterized FlaG/YvyC family protein
MSTALGSSGITPARNQAPPVNLHEEFAKGANGPVLAGQVSFDGREQKTDATNAVSKVVDAQSLKAAVQQIDSYVRNLGRSLAISVDESSGSYVVQVQNMETKELIRQVPSEDVMRISQAIEDRNSALNLMGERGAGGLFLDALA